MSKNFEERRSVSFNNPVNLRVLIYSDHFYPSIGGSENYALDLANELSRIGCTVGVVTAEFTDVPDNFHFKIYRIMRPIYIRKLNFNFMEIPRIIADFKPDIFHINYQTGGENLLIFLLRLMKLPIVLTYHADHFVLLGKMLDELQVLFSFRFVNRIMVQSSRDESKFISRGFPRTKLTMFGFNAVDTKLFQCNKRSEDEKEGINLICIAKLDTLHKYKGIDSLIDLVFRDRNLLSKLNFKLKIVGSGNLRIFYEDMVRKLGLSFVTFLGHLSTHELIDEICKSDFLILPSISKAEGFGRVVLEALSCGTPVIVSKYAGVSELVGKYDAGKVYDPFSSFSLGEYFQTARENSGLLSNQKENGYRMLQAEKLTIDDIISQTLGIYYESIR